VGVVRCMGDPLRSMRSRALIWISTALVAALGVLVLMKVTARSRPVLYEYREAGDPEGYSLHSIFNPFRDRAPEVAAEEFLVNLRELKLDAALDSLALAEEAGSQPRELERAYPLRTWRLVQRRDNDSNVELYFWVTRANYPPDDEAPFWMILRREGSERRWRVHNFETSY
jgi:hypothetical protein